MTVFNEYWELPTSRFWLVEIDIDRGRDFPISPGCICGEKVATELKYKNIHSFLLFCSPFMCQNLCAKRLWENCKEDEQTLANLVHLTAVRKQNVSYYKPVYIKRIKFFLFAI